MWNGFSRLMNVPGTLAATCALTCSLFLAGCGKGEVTFYFDANGGTGTMEPMVVSKGDEVPLAENAFEREGYEFRGWNLEADGSDNDYEDGQVVRASFDGTLYAQWEALPEAETQAELETTEAPAEAEALPAPAEEAAPAAPAEEPQASEPVAEAEAPEAPAEEESGDLILLEANSPGAYGMEFTNYGGGSFDDTATRMGWFVPAGSYTLTVLKTRSPKLAVWYGSIEPSINADGIPESMGFECAYLALDESAEIYVPVGGCVYFTGNDGLIKLVSRN